MSILDWGRSSFGCPLEGRSFVLGMPSACLEIYKAVHYLEHEGGLAIHFSFLGGLEIQSGDEFGGACRGLNSPKIPLTSGVGLFRCSFLISCF